MIHGAYCALIVRRQGSTVNVYKSDGIGAALPLTVLATFADGTALGVHILYLGSTAAGAQPFGGTLGSLLVWNRALADSELILEAATLRGDVRRKWLLP